MSPCELSCVIVILVCVPNSVSSHKGQLRMCPSGQVLCVIVARCCPLMLPPCPPQGVIRAGQAAARGWPLSHPLEHQPLQPPHPHSGPERPGGTRVGGPGLWLGIVPAWAPAHCPHPATHPRHLVDSACACGSSPLSCMQGPSRWRAGTGPSPVCVSFGLPCRATCCGLVMTASPCTTAACRSREVKWGT